MLSVAALLASTSVALAQPEAPVLTPPRLEHAPDVLYPDGAKGDAEVILLVTVGKDGAVIAAEVQSGAEPFASAAKAAASDLRFTPATRAGAPVGARIRYAFTFHEPPPPPPEPTPSKAPTVEAPPGAAKPAPRPLEVTVRAEKPPPSVQTMTRAEVRQLPGAFGDPFRAIDSLPGVTPIVSGLPFFYIRGAPPGNVGYFLDGVRVPYLFHVAVGPSVVPPMLVDHVDLYSGGYPAQYGRYAGAIVAAETTAPKDAFHGEGNIRLFDAGGVAEAGFADGKGTALLGGRYSYTAALFSVFSPEIKLDYRDYQARFTYDISPKEKITLFSFGSYDLLRQITNGVNTIVFGSEFYRADLRYDLTLPEGGKFRLATTAGYDRSRVTDQRNARDLSLGTRLEYRQPIGEDVVVRAGANVDFDGYSADQVKYADPDDPDTKGFNALFPSRTDAAAGAWADIKWKVTPRLEVTPGIRVDVYRSGSASAVGVEPRLAVTTLVGEHVRLLQAFGVANQPPSFIAPIPGLAIGNLQGGLQTSLQASSGVEIEVPKLATATITVFDDVFFNMSDTLAVHPSTRDPFDLPRTLGNAYGLEVYVRRQLAERIGGYVSYTLSRSVRRLDRDVFPAAFDRTHVLSAALAYDLGRGWLAGSRFTFYTGAPSVSTIATTPDNPHPSDPPRDPPFYRLDVRVEKRWTFSRARYLSFVAEMLNATLDKEIVNGAPIGPISVPSLGLEGGF